MTAQVHPSNPLVSFWLNITGGHNNGNKKEKQWNPFHHQVQKKKIPLLPVLDPVGLEDKRSTGTTGNSNIKMGAYTTSYQRKHSSAKGFSKNSLVEKNVLSLFHPSLSIVREVTNEEYDDHEDDRSEDSIDDEEYNDEAFLKMHVKCLSLDDLASFPPPPPALVAFTEKPLTPPTPETCKSEDSFTSNTSLGSWSSDDDENEDKDDLSLESFVDDNQLYNNKAYFTIVKHKRMPSWKSHGWKWVEVYKPSTSMMRVRLFSIPEAQALYCPPGMRDEEDEEEVEEIRVPAEQSFKKVSKSPTRHRRSNNVFIQDMELDFLRVAMEEDGYPNWAKKQNIQQNPNCLECYPPVYAMGPVFPAGDHLAYVRNNIAAQPSPQAVHRVPHVVATATWGMNMHHEQATPQYYAVPPVSTPFPATKCMIKPSRHKFPFQVGDPSILCTINKMCTVPNPATSIFPTSITTKKSTLPMTS